MFAITKFSRRARGQAVALDLVRAVVKGRNRSFVRRRLSRSFAEWLA